MPSNPFKAEPTGTRLALNRIGLRVRNLERRFVNQGTTVGVTTETLYYDTLGGDTVSTSEALEDGKQYLITVQGTYTGWNENLDVGTPEADAMFPSSTSGRSSTEVGVDADTLFAYPSDRSGHTIGHTDTFQISLDGGATFSHHEPDDGPHSTPVADHLYKYTVTGSGDVASFRVSDVPGAYGDNYGKLSITIQALDSSGSGGGGGPGGAGSLVPPSDATLAGEILRVNGSGIPAWQAGVTEGDLELSDVTTGDVSTLEHGFAPKSPGGTTKFLRADGTWDVPPGGTGSLPDPTGEPDGAWLRTSGGAAVWDPTPQVTEADVTLSDVSTLNVSTTKHGLAPKAPSDTGKFLRGDGTWAQVTESGILLADVTTDDVSTSKHGFAPKAPNDTKKWFRGDATWATITRTLNVVIANDGAVLAVGIAGDVFIDFACTITKVTLLADQSGSVVVDIWKAAYASYPPSVANSVTASDTPTISAATKSQDSTLTGWTTAISAGDVLRFNVNSVTTITQLLVALTLSS